MTSSIGQGAYGKPTHINIPNSQFQGSTSGIGGQSTLEYSKYDSTNGFQFSYVPGSKRFTRLGGYRYHGPTGNWGRVVLRKVNLRKQVTGAAGILSSNPLARMKIGKFVALNYGLERVDKFLPRGGNVPRVVDTSNVEDPRSFYSDYNWGNAQQPHEIPPGGYGTIPPNDPPPKIDPRFIYKPTGRDVPESDLKNPPNTPGEPDLEIDQIVEDDRAYAYKNPMSGPAGIGGGFDANTLSTKLEALPDSYKILNNDLPGNKDFANRRASTITHIYDNPTVQVAKSREDVNSSGLAKGSGFLGGVSQTFEKGFPLKSETKKRYVSPEGRKYKIHKSSQE